jgi:Trypsin-co-occurring domain 1
MAAGSRLIEVRVGGTLIEVEAVPVAGTGTGRFHRLHRRRASPAAGKVLDAFARAQETIIEVARSTASMVERAGAASRPERVEVEFGLKFSMSGRVIMAGVAGEASLKVTLSYDVATRPVAGLPAGAAGEGAEVARGAVTGID